MRLARVFTSLTFAALITSGLVTASPAKAATTTTVTIVGTSDVEDSGLIITDPGDPSAQSALVNDFEAAYPQYQLNYIEKGTGAAIAYAEAGTASGLIVHAESQENTFVDPGAGKPSYSYEKYGRALFFGDFVLLGPSGDPADVAANDPHNIVAAFQAIATAGAAGHADFVSRADSSGTATEEHAIWGDLVDSNGVSTIPGVALCPFTGGGGGYAPSSSASCPTTPSYPTWYDSTSGATQSANVEAANACNFPNAQANSNVNDCYVFTDQGTFDYLKANQTISELDIVTQHNDATAPGGTTLLYNYFHGYTVNPAAVPSDSNINVAGAEAFLDYLTSPAGQTVASNYLAGSGNPPFTGDAAPVITATGIPAVVPGGTTITVKGHLFNVASGTPPLADKTVDLVADHGGIATTVATATTDSTGAFKLVFAPTQSATYSVATKGFSQLENDAVTPNFYDLLQPASLKLGTMRVVASPHMSRVSHHGLTLDVAGTLSPAPTKGNTGTVSLLVKTPGAQKFHLDVTKTIEVGKRTFALKYRAAEAGNYAFDVRYAIADQVSSGESQVHHRRLS